MEKAPVPEEVAVGNAESKSDHIRIGNERAESRGHPEARGHGFAHELVADRDTDKSMCEGRGHGSAFRSRLVEAQNLTEYVFGFGLLDLRTV